jgi:hypothetical protein
MTGFDIIKVKPLDVTDVKNATPILTDGHVYGFTAGAISHITKWISEQNSTAVHAIYNSIRFATTAYEDVKHDGKLDGNSAKGLVAEGIVRITPEIYRSRLATNILVMANDPKNLTGLTPSQLINDAVLMNGNNSSVFDGSSIIPLENNKPVLTNFTHTDNQIVAGTVKIGFDIVDLTGIESVNMSIDGVFKEAAADLSKIEFTVNLLSLSDADHVFKFDAKNNAGGITTHNLTLKVSNQALAIDTLNPAEGQHIKGTHDFSARVVDAFGIQSTQFVIDNAATYNPVSLTNPVFSLNTVLMGDGAHAFKVKATSLNSFNAEVATNFVVDNTNPVVSWGLANTVYANANFAFSATANDAIGVDSAKLFMDGAEVKVFSVFPNLTHTIDTTQSPDGDKTIVLEVKDKAGNSVTETRTVKFDNTKPDLSITNPASGQTFSADFISSFFSNSTDIEKVDVKINGVVKGLIDFPAGKTYPIDIASIGNHGANTIQGTATDFAGNTISSTINTFNLDFTPNMSALAGSGGLNVLNTNCRVSAPSAFALTICDCSDNRVYNFNIPSYFDGLVNNSTVKLYGKSHLTSDSATYDLSSGYSFNGGSTPTTAISGSYSVSKSGSTLSLSMSGLGYHLQGANLTNLCGVRPTRVEFTNSYGAKSIFNL